MRAFFQENNNNKRESVKNDSVEFNGYGWDGINKKLIQQKVKSHFNCFDSVTDGKPISVEAAKNLVGERTKWKGKKENAPVSITFDANCLLLLLCQKGAVGIRFYDAINDDGDATLVLCAVDIFKNDIGMEIPNGRDKASIICNEINELQEDPLIIEVGGVDEIGHFSDYV